VLPQFGSGDPTEVRSKPDIHDMTKGKSDKPARFEARISPVLHRLLKRAADL
jgi:hypothetical protein